MTTLKFIENKYKIKEINFLTCQKMVENHYEGKQLIPNCRVGFLALCLDNCINAKTQDLESTRNCLNDVILKKCSMTDDIVYCLRKSVLRNSDIISNIKCQLLSSSNQILNHLCKEIKIICGDKVLKSNNCFESNKVNLDVLIPLICSQYDPVYIELILSSQIIYYPDMNVIFEYKHNYLDTGPRGYLAQNKFVISTDIGFFCGGKYNKKKTIEMSDNQKISDLFKINKILSQKNDSSKYIIFLSAVKINGKTLKCFNNFFSDAKSYPSPQYLKFQLFDDSGDDHYFDRVFSIFKYDNINLLCHKKEITIKSEFVDFEVCYNLKSDKLYYHLQITHFFNT